MTGNLKLPVIDFSSPDRGSTVQLIRQACLDSGFFYLVNHGIPAELLAKVFEESGKLFSLSLEEKMKLLRNEGHCGYTPPFAEKLDPSSQSEGDPKESFYIGPLENDRFSRVSNQWPSQEKFPLWRETMERYYGEVLSTLHRVLSTGQERYSIAFFLEPNPNCLVECLDTCQDESNPPKFPPVRSGDYLKERLRMTYAANDDLLKR